jgi:hypothetical protein
MACLLAVPSVGSCAPAGATQPGQTAQAMLNIVVVKGEGAINNIKQRTAREVVVQVEDENRKPVAGASVAFLLPDSGPGATFSDGGRLFTTVTDQNGRASVSSMKPNQSVGAFSISVTASHLGTRGTAVITQRNILPLAIAGMSVGVFVAVLAAAAAAGIVVGVRAGSNDSPVNNSARVSIGQPSLP